ncbi:hypothetical protein AB4238_03460 [Shewanella sp. 10N.286.45.A1]|uniref:hypothetical protein n=1 Tax=Shewanella sp. 10N.286.45.A1 TaxID=3229694 RepID=UPI003550F84C
MGNYYTNFIDPGNSGGSVPTPDTCVAFTPSESNYQCRFCNETFTTDDKRVHHEWDKHPSKTPQLLIFGRSVGSTSVSVRTKLTNGDIELTHYEKIFSNDIEMDYVGMLELLQSKDKYYFELVVTNQGTRKEFKIDIDVADSNELEKVDEFFWLFLSRDDFTDELVTQFVHACAELPTVRNYVDGIVKYLQGIMAKDNNAKVLTFEDFEPRFNQARTQLKQYNTPISFAIQAVIDFNQNQFDSVYLNATPGLQAAMAFFNGSSLASLSTISSKTGNQLPIDRVTSLLIDDVIVVFNEHTVETVRDCIDTLPKRNISLNDRMKFDFLLLRKAYNTGQIDLVQKMKKRLSHHESFNLMKIEEHHNA